MITYNKTSSLLNESNLMVFKIGFSLKFYHNAFSQIDKTEKGMQMLLISNERKKNILLFFDYMVIFYLIDILLLNALISFK